MYKYEMHCHTAQVSRCGRIDAEELVSFYHSMGYSGICITDHFLNGNTTVPSGIDWGKRIELFMEGYKRAAAEGDRLGISVFPAWEYSFHGTDFLTYCLSEEWLYNNPDCLEWSVSEYCDRVHADGGYIIQAHPFREDYYIEMIRLMPRHVDGVETLNACRTDFENKMADKYADAYGLLKIAGSDNHVGRLPRLAAVEFSKKIHTLEELVVAVKSGHGRSRLYNIK